jgi:hypothetical protein
MKRLIAAAALALGMGLATPPADAGIVVHIGTGYHHHYYHHHYYRHRYWHTSWACHWRYHHKVCWRVRRYW